MMEFKCDCCGAINEINTIHRKKDHKSTLKAAWLRAMAVPSDSACQVVKFDDREDFWKKRLTLTKEEEAELNGTTRFLWWVSTEIEEDVVLHGLVQVLPPHKLKVIRSWKKVWP